MDIELHLIVLVLGVYWPSNCSIKYINDKAI